MGLGVGVFWEGRSWDGFGGWVLLEDMGWSGVGVLGVGGCFGSLGGRVFRGKAGVEVGLVWLGL